MKNLALLKPRLKKHTLIVDGGCLILEDETHSHQVSLPAERKIVLELLTGQFSIKELVEQYLAKTGKISFRAIFSTLQALDEAHLLTEPLGLTESKTKSDTALERPEAFFMRPLFEIPLLRHLALPFLRQPLLLIVAAGFVAGISVDLCLFWLEHFSTRGFFHLPASSGMAGYSHAIPAFLVLASALMSFKGVAKALVLLVATGHIYNVRLRVHLFGVSIGVSDVSIHGLTRHLWLLLYFLTCALLYIFAAAALPAFPNHIALVHSFETLAVLLTFIDLDPYRRSDLTLLIDRFFRGGDARKLTAYLKNRALFSAAGTTRSFSGETRLVIYSSVALLWTVGFSLFSLDLLSANFPNLVLAAQSASTLAERCSAGVLLLILASVFGSLFFDLASTIASNVLFPMLTPYLRFLQMINTSEISNFDQAALLKTLRQISFFQELGDESLRTVAATGKLKEFKSGTRLIIQGDPGQALYVLLSGSVNILKRDETGLQSRICTLGPNSVFGEIALIRDCVRTADAVALDHIRVLEIEKAPFRKLVDGLGATGGNTEVERILDRIALGHYLSSASIFREMPVESLGMFREMGSFERRAAGETIIREGDTDRSFYLILRGVIEIRKGQTIVTTLKQSEFFGEIALLGNVARTATASCLEDCLLLKLESTAYWRVLSENIALAMNLETVAELRQATLEF